MNALTRLLYFKPHQFQSALLKILHSGWTAIPSWSTFYNPLEDRNDYMLQYQVRNLSTLTIQEIFQLVVDICISLEIQCQAMETSSLLAKTNYCSSRCKDLLDGDYEEGCTWIQDMGRYTFIKKNGTTVCTPRLVYRILIRHSYNSAQYYPVLVLPRIHITPRVPIHLRHLEKRYTTFFYDWSFYETNDGIHKIQRVSRKVVLLQDVHMKIAYIGIVEQVNLNGTVQITIKPMDVVRVETIREVIKESGLYEARIEYTGKL